MSDNNCVLHNDDNSRVVENFSLFGLFFFKSWLKKHTHKKTTEMQITICFPGLRVLLKPQKDDKAAERKRKNAENCKRYREKMKDDPSFKEYNKQKCKVYRNRPLTEEQLAAKRENARLRAKKCRSVHLLFF